MSIADASADARGLGLDDGHACCDGCGADWAADEDCADGCPGSREACGVCRAQWPRWYAAGYRCEACRPDATPAGRMAMSDVQ